MRTAPPVELNSEQRTALERSGASAPGASAGGGAGADLCCWQPSGLENKQIARRMGVTPEKAARWRDRFLAGGIVALGAS